LRSGRLLRIILLPAVLLSLAAFRVREDSQHTPRPILLCPVNGVTVSLVGRDSHDYYQDSVTIDVSVRRPSRIPYTMNVSSDVGMPLITLPALLVPGSQQLPFGLSGRARALLSETWVSDFTGRNSGYLGFPTGSAFPRW
jgi:hypothetical protein